ncbi:hypothetical protein DU35_19490, partial [Methanosarcina mazei]
DVYKRQGVDRSKVLTAENVMWRPEPLVSINSGPRVAVQLMKEYGISSIFVVEGKNRLLKGIIMIDDAVEALKSKKNLESIIREIPSIPLDMPLSEIIPLIANSSYPLPVVDESRKLKGIIIRGTVLGALAMSEDVPEEASAGEGEPVQDKNKEILDNKGQQESPASEKGLSSEVEDISQKSENVEVKM